MIHPFGLVFAALVAASGPSPALAQPAPLRATGCEPEIERAVLAALEVELVGASEDARATLDAADTELRCDAAGATVRVLAAGVASEQRIEAGPAHARRIALALVELLEASAAPLPLPPPEPAEPPPAPADPVAWIDVSGGAWLGGSPLLILGTVQVAAELVPTPLVAIGLAVAGSFGGLDVREGRIDLRLFGGGASLRLGGALGPITLRAGPALRAGAAWWQGTATEPWVIGREVLAGWLGVGAIGTATVRWGDLPLRAGVEVEGGGVAIHSRALATTGPGAAVSDGWIELRLGVGVAIE